MSADVRALAAQALAQVALGGASLREAMERHAPKLADSRDRALLMALVSDGARWWPRFDAALERLLERPLRRKEPAVHALLVLGLVQLEVLELADYAAVAATVEAARALKRPQLAGLVNAVLRRWQRERAAHLAALDAPVVRDVDARQMRGVHLRDAEALPLPQDPFRQQAGGGESGGHLSCISVMTHDDETFRSSCIHALLFCERRS